MTQGLCPLGTMDSYTSSHVGTDAELDATNFVVILSLADPKVNVIHKYQTALAPA